MARTKQSLTKYLSNKPTAKGYNNLIYAKEYLTRAIRDKKILTYGKPVEDQQAKDKFYKLLSAPNDNKLIDKYSNWIEQYLTDKEWERCKTAVRQKVHAKKNRYKFKSFRLSVEYWRKLRYYAQEKNISLSNAIEEIIVAAEKSLAHNKNNKAWLKGG